MAKALAAQQRKKEKDAKAEAMHAAALAEDPTAFDYDGVYDDMKVRARPRRGRARGAGRGRCLDVRPLRGTWLT